MAGALDRAKKAGKKIVPRATAGQFQLLSGQPGQRDLAQPGQHGRCAASLGLYFKDAWIGWASGMHIFRVGTYKSAIEPLVRNDMSAEDRGPGGLDAAALAVIQQRLSPGPGLDADGPARADSGPARHPGRQRPCGQAAHERAARGRAQDPARMRPDS